MVATGGALEPANSFCYLLDYDFHPNTCSYRYQSKEDLPGEFSLLDHTGASHKIDWFEPDIVQKMLGVYIAMDGNQEAQKEYLTNMSLEYATQIKLATFDWNTAFFTFQRSFLKPIDYCLPVTQLSISE